MSDLASRLDGIRNELKKTDTKILVMDIERIKGEANIEFWDLGDYKNRRIRADDVVQWPRSICVAWSWLGDTDIHFSAEWMNGGTEKMLRDVWTALDEADIVVGHNVLDFDLKKLNSEFRDLGLTPPRPYKVIDTLKEARKHFGDESKTLDALNSRIGIAGKTDKYDPEVAKAAVEGDRISQAILRAYNEGDIIASESLFLSILPWIKFGPHINMKSEEHLVTCSHCNSSNIELSGETMANIYRYKLYTCKDCGGHSKGALSSRGSKIKSA